MKRVGMFSVSPELMMDVLKIPKGTVIRAMSWNINTYAGSFDIVISSPDLEPVKVGEEMPRYMPMITRHEDGAFTWEWGDPK